MKFLTKITHKVKNARNLIYLLFYKNCVAVNEKEFLKKIASLKYSHIYCIIAFEQPQVLEWMFKLAKKNVHPFHLLVFDNSRNLLKRNEIESICIKYSISYLSLPPNGVRHPSRSHGLAMSWVYYRVIKKIRPKWFGYLDHDMIPVNKTNLNFLNNKIYYGIKRKSVHSDFWTLWAGYCIFNFNKVKNLPINFLYDFSRHLDTGGMNWDSFYKFCDLTKTKFAPQKYIEIDLFGKYKNIIQLIDKTWIHIGGVSYSGDQYNSKVYDSNGFYTNFINELEAGKSFKKILSENKHKYIN